MRDISLTFRDKNGKATFGFTGDEISGCELLLQKLTISLLSDNLNSKVKTSFGGELNSTGKMSINENDLNEFKLFINTNLSNIEKEFKKTYDANSSLEERLDTISLLNASYDKKTRNVDTSFLVKTQNGSVSILSLPVRI